MRLQILCAALLAASSAFAQQGRDTNPPGSTATAPARSPATSEITEGRTGTSASSAGTSGTTAPRSPTSDTSVGTSGAVAGTASAGTTTSTGRCDTLLGDERDKCLKEQAATGIVK
jgi:hypothetical protein